MSSKPDSQPDTKPGTESEKPAKRGIVVCGIRGPGPKYLLRTLVGYDEHCLSKYRNPAYTFGIRTPARQICQAPGPKYLIAQPKRGGFSFGFPGRTFDTGCGPGPKYILPSPKSPAFTLKSRTEHRKISPTPGPYNVNLPIPGPAFYIASRLPGRKCDCTPAPRPYSIDFARQKAPVYSLGLKLDAKEICRSPGPKYHLKRPPQMPQYSFGVRHSECAPPYILECDDAC
ncbi:uncharacterized protein LOC100884001 [Megachile rotundata]|uniref:uncharacterized protein LOC100884001 n=1 Tax=Megachile rotundata TaxID=143995 RepID=UPI000258E66D